MVIYNDRWLIVGCPNRWLIVGLFIRKQSMTQYKINLERSNAHHIKR